MPAFSLYSTLPLADQMLHGLHVMLCAFAVLVASVPLLTDKGSSEHKIAGLIYLPLSLTALLLASYLAWSEASAVLFCFNCFCAYLLMSGWRATHENAAPTLIDFAIPASLFILAIGVTIDALMMGGDRRALYLLFFALNAMYLSWRDARSLRQRAYWNKRKIFIKGLDMTAAPMGGGWLGRHIAGMVGSVLANLSVVVLTLLPLTLHWVWSATLLLAGLMIFLRQRRQKRQRLRQFPRFRTSHASSPARAPDQDEDNPYRRAA